MAWEFLVRGVTASEVVSQLESLVHDGEAISNADPVEQHILAQRYLRWCEATESVLRESFVSVQLPRSLMTDRHWQIRAIDSATRLAFGMIQGEVLDQLRMLGAVLVQIRHYSTMVKPAPGQSLLLLDTNVYAHGQAFQDVRWDRHVPGSSVLLLMPLIVVDEIDKLKDRNDGVRPVLRSLDSLFAGNDSLAPIQIRPEVVLQVVDEPTSHVRLGRADDEIVRQASYYASVSQSPLILMTRDRGMRLRALAAGIDARLLPSELERRQSKEQH